MTDILGELQAGAVARWVDGGPTPWLSALHAIGYTLVMSGAVVGNLRLLGAVLRQQPVADILRAAARVLLAGLVLSVVTGALLFAPRAAHVAANSTFQLKLLLLVAATLFHFIASSRAQAWDGSVQRAVGATGLGLWLALAVTACVFLLFE